MCTPFNSANFRWPLEAVDPSTVEAVVDVRLQGTSRGEHGVELSLGLWIAHNASQGKMDGLRWCVREKISVLLTGPD